MKENLSNFQLVVDETFRIRFDEFGKSKLNVGQILHFNKINTFQFETICTLNERFIFLETDLQYMIDKNMIKVF